MINIKEMLKEFDFQTPASNDVIDSFEKTSNMILPAEYKIFLKLTNGGEGFIGANSYLILWPVEELIELNKSYKIDDYAPGLFIFGSNGGGEAYAFDTRMGIMDVVQVPFVGMDMALTQKIATSFDKFIEKLYNAVE